MGTYCLSFVHYYKTQNVHPTQTVSHTFYSLHIQSSPCSAKGSGGLVILVLVVCFFIILWAVADLAPV